jgi:hypothetical protein
MIFKGIITSKITQTSSKTGKDYTTFALGEKKFNCFDADTIKNFQEGDNVEIITKTNGKYENMTSMKKIDVEAPKPQNNAKPNAPEFSSQPSIISQEIVTQLKRIADALEKKDGVK